MEIPGKPNAIVITKGMLQQPEAKTAHGLIRGTTRFNIAGVLDDVYAGKDAGEVLDGKHRGIPVFASVSDALANIKDLRYCIIGVATHGGILPTAFINIIEECIRSGISIVNGLHEYLRDNPHIVSLANKYHVELIDIRRPKPRNELHFWHGGINKVDVPIIAVLGMDCAIGKRTTCKMVVEGCAENNINAQMIP